VVRIRGRMRFLPNVIEAGNAGTIAMGIIVASTEAFNAGATAMPNPADQQDSADWMWHDVAIPGDSATDSAADANIVIDNKSKRIMHQANKVLVLVVKNDSGAHTYNWSCGIRTLLLL